MTDSALTFKSRRGVVELRCIKRWKHEGKHSLNWTFARNFCRNYSWSSGCQFFIASFLTCSTFAPKKLSFILVALHLSTSAQTMNSWWAPKRIYIYITPVSCRGLPPTAKLNFTLIIYQDSSTCTETLCLQGCRTAGCKKKTKQQDKKTLSFIACHLKQRCRKMFPSVFTANVTCLNRWIQSRLSSTLTDYILFYTC